MEQLTEAEEIRRGELLVDLLCLHPVNKASPRSKRTYHTQWGSKTPLGIFRTVARIVEKGE